MQQASGGELRIIQGSIERQEPTAQTNAGTVGSLVLESKDVNAGYHRASQGNKPKAVLTIRKVC